MSQRPTADYPIPPATTSGSDLAALLGDTEQARNSNDSGAARPAYILPGGLWSKPVTGGFDVMLYDGTNDLVIGGVNAAAGLADAPADGKLYGRLNGNWEVALTQAQADGAYAPKAHNHDTVYAALNHTHAGYAPTNHIHTEYVPRAGAATKTSGDLTFATNVAVAFGATRFYASSTTVLRMDLSGHTFYIRDGSTTRFTFDRSGNFTATGNVTANSDQRLKTDLVSIAGALDKVRQLAGYTYRRIDNDDPLRTAGVIAQEVQAVLPEGVREDEDGILSVNLMAVIGLLVSAVNELAERVDGSA